MNTKQKIILSSFLVVAFVIVFGIIFYGISKQQTVTPKQEQEELSSLITPITQTPTPQPQEQPVIPTKNPLGLEIPKEVYHYTGTISEITGNSIILNAKASDNYLVQDVTLTVYLDENTRLEKYITPLYLPPGKSPKDYQQGGVMLTDFKIGNRVTVYADTNIAGLNEFTATKITSVEMVNK